MNRTKSTAALTLVTMMTGMLLAALPTAGFAGKYCVNLPTDTGYTVRHQPIRFDYRYEIFVDTFHGYTPTTRKLESGGYTSPIGDAKHAAYKRGKPNRSVRAERYVFQGQTVCLDMSALEGEWVKYAKDRWPDYADDIHIRVYWVQFYLDYRTDVTCPRLSATRRDFTYYLPLVYKPGSTYSTKRVCEAAPAQLPDDY